MSLGPAEFEALARSLMAIADPALRVAYVRHSLSGQSPEAVAELFEFAMNSGGTARGPRGELLQALSLALADEACVTLREAVRVVLEGRSGPELALALARSPHEEEPETQRVPDFGKGRHVSLGERKSLARGHDRELIARSLRDPDPTVMRILLGNPLVTETDIVRLCARRPVSTDVLREVFRSPRWIVRYRVKVALVLNPYAPLDIALQLLPFMQVPDLRRVVASAELAEALRTSARARVPKRVAVERP